MKHLFLGIYFLFSPFLLEGGSSTPSDILIYGEGTTEIETYINDYQNIETDSPIAGTIMITHDKKNSIDAGSFRMGEKPLKTVFIQSTAMTPYSPLEVSIYTFELKGLKAGVQTLPPIKVRVGGKEYAADPLVVEVASRS